MSRLFGTLLAVSAAQAAGCNSRPLNAETTDASGGGGGGLGLAGAAGGTFTPTHKVDMLFVVDDSSFTRSLQQNLLRNFPTMITTLRNAPSPPDLRIAVISTDMGAGDGSLGGCDADGGKNGIFQFAARGSCTTSGLAPGATYIADTGIVRNYTGNLEDVFACIAELGETGCGFEHQLASMARALGADGKAPPEENQGFLRDEAFLFIVLVTNEDDCSAPPGSGLFDGPDAIDAPLGFLGNYRCNEFGHLCNGVKPPRLPPSGNASDIVTLDGCVSAEDTGMLIPVANVASQIRSLKRYPDDQIVIAAITGPNIPYTVHWVVRPGETAPRTHISASCTSADGSFADPAVRVAQFAQAFGANGLLLSACADNYAPGLQRLAELLNRAP